MLTTRANVLGAIRSRSVFGSGSARRGSIRIPIATKLIVSFLIVITIVSVVFMVVGVRLIVVGLQMVMLGFIGQRLGEARLPPADGADDPPRRDARPSRGSSRLMEPSWGPLPMGCA